ncbi:gas vesicle protein [Scopulibacillus daqui]|uniref:Gas vesicle protein n=1 Tax=Scopulibacillus daqui TaxID=1469162 RepID=A0ABS2PVH2_9BACL|nr:hypothetical protein [Scopulibacillus daqui]MBM7644052.1 gas vesicle protein [Scopulibacillus daqui]
MDEQKEALSYAQLVNRKQYYQEKSLKLEKEFIFAKEKINSLEQQLKDIGSKWKKLEDKANKLDEIKKSYEQLQEKYQQEVQEYEQKLTALEKEAEQLRKNQKDDGAIDYETYQQRVRSYEQLLSEVQEEINEKDRELAVYKKRLNIFEKRLKAGGELQVSIKPDLNKKDTAEKPHIKVIPYIDYAIIIDKNRCMIRGDLIIENVGEQTLGTPMVCFRFYPGDAALIKGRIMNAQDLEYKEPDQQLQWVFLESDWAEEAKERGEIWIHPLSSVKTKANELLTLSDFQIPIEMKYYDHVSVEVFVYFQDSDYKAKSVNQILINV